MGMVAKHERLETFLEYSSWSVNGLQYTCTMWTDVRKDVDPIALVVKQLYNVLHCAYVMASVQENDQLFLENIFTVFVDYQPNLIANC